MKYNGTWFYISNGMLDWSIQTLSRVDNKGTWYCVRNGQLDWEYTGLFEYYGTWYYVRNGRVTWTYNGLCKYGGSWFYVRNGILDWSYSNLILYNGDWYYIHNGMLDWTIDTLSQVDGKGVWYFVKQGRLDWSYSGLYNYYGIWYYINNGRVDWNYTGLCFYNGSWFYVRQGMLDWGYTGLCFYQGDYYYIEDGMINLGYNGPATLPGFSREFEVVDGRLSGGIVPPSETVSKKARATLDKIGWNLRAAFDWSAHMPYTYYTESGDSGTAYYANYGFDHQTGNCYVMAATFVAMARELGYEVYQISGHIPLANGGLANHSWTEVKIGDKFYVFDPNFENERFGGANGYQIYYGMPGTWRYVQYYRMHN